MVRVLGMLAAIALTAFCWGVYGPVLHFGREAMHSPLRPFVCVGAAYFLIAVLIPLLLLARGGERGTWTTRGVVWSMLAGTAGSLGALGVMDPDFVPTKGDILVLFGTKDEVTRFTGETS